MIFPGKIRNEQRNKIPGELIDVFIPERILFFYKNEPGRGYIHLIEMTFFICPVNITIIIILPLNSLT